MKPERFPISIHIKNGRFWQVVPWFLATAEQKAQWRTDQEIVHGEDSSARGQKPANGKRERRKQRRDQKFHRV